MAVRSTPLSVHALQPSALSLEHKAHRFRPNLQGEWHTNYVKQFIRSRPLDSDKPSWLNDSSRVLGQPAKKTL
ncbi:MAG: hypothetical protein ACI87E_004216 [Mariniblastus sp.]|jgi:hypothetical protein